MFAAASCSPSTGIGIEPLHPVRDVIWCAWLSWPSEYVTVTRAQLIVPSSGSLPVTVNGIVSPKLNSCPFPGVDRLTVGAVLPTLMMTLAVPGRPCGSRTVNVAVYVPLALYVFVGLAAVDVV